MTAGARYAAPRPLRQIPPNWSPGPFIPFLALLLLLGPGLAFAHTVGISRGEYAARGTEVSVELVFARPELLGAVPQLDLNQDGSVSSPEATASRTAVEAAIVDGLDVVSESGPCKGTLKEMKPTENDGVSVRAVYACPGRPGGLSVKARFLDVLSAGHRHLVTVKAAPADVHAVLFQGSPGFRIEATGAGPAQGATLAATVSSLFRLGIEHILTGYDHLLFLLGLVLIGGRMRSLLAAVSAFTVAHSITLGSAALGLWAPSPRFIEPLIALTIGYVGVENWFIKDAKRRWLITFPFGLIHGFGFAGALGQISLPRAQVLPALASFNIGVEVGQVAFLLLVLPVVLWLRKQPWFALRGVRVMSAGIALAGGWWFLTRLASSLGS